jgi:hypothetical protein
MNSSVNNSSAERLLAEPERMNSVGLMQPLLSKPSPPPKLMVPPPKNDTILMAILCTQNQLGPNATVRECLEKYLEIKMKEIDDIAVTMNFAFMSRL